MRKWIIGAMLLVLAVGIYWRIHSRETVLGAAYIGEPTVTMWNTTAQVHEPVGELHWGDMVEIMARTGLQVKVRTADRTEGWVENRSLLDSVAWQNEKNLYEKSRRMPLQAVGHTKVLSNLHLDAQRDSLRAYQLPGSVPVAVVARKVADVPATPGASAAAANEGPKREDWLLIYSPLPQSAGSARDLVADVNLSSSAAATQADLAMGNSDQVQAAAAGRHIPPVAGWVLSRFVQLDYPDVIRDYATSSGVHPLAWFVLNYAGDSAAPKPQYLMVGSKGGDDFGCDFSMMRVYTWDAPKERYETAFVEGDLCGYLPVQVSRQTGSGNPQFAFSLLNKDGAKEDALFRMTQTVVRRIRENTAAAPKKKHR